MFLKSLFFILLSSFLFSCTEVAKDGTRLDTTTSGNIKIGFDETFQFVGEDLVSAFEQTYIKAKLNPVYLPESQLFDALLRDSLRSIIVTRKLTTEEVAFFDKRPGTLPKITLLAYDALALVLHPSRKDTLIRYTFLDSLIIGKARTWKDGTPVTIVFDNQGSSTLRYMNEKFGNIDLKNTFAAKGNRDAIDYVANNKGAIGIIGVGWVSDPDDQTKLKYISKVKVASVGINPQDSTYKAGKYYFPWQANLYYNTYPLKRSVYAITREARSGLGTGFASYAASDKGQGIIRMLGLLPAQSLVTITVKAE